MVMDLKGQKLLKVIGILMIIFGGLSLLFSIGIGFAAALILVSTIGSAALIMLGALPIVSAALELAAGIVGVSAAGMPSVRKIRTAVVLGVLVLVLSVASLAYSAINSAAMGVNTYTIALDVVSGLVIPVLYLVGVFRYKNALVKLLTGGSE